MEKEAKDIAIVYMVAGISSRFGGKIKQLHGNFSLFKSAKDYQDLKIKQFAL